MWRKGKCEIEKRGLWHHRGRHDTFSTWDDHKSCTRPTKILCSNGYRFSYQLRHCSSVFRISRHIHTNMYPLEVERGFEQSVLFWPRTRYDLRRRIFRTPRCWRIETEVGVLVTRQWIISEVTIVFNNRTEIQAASHKLSRYILFNSLKTKSNN